MGKKRGAIPSWIGWLYKRRRAKRKKKRVGRRQENCRSSIKDGYSNNTNIHHTGPRAASNFLHSSPTHNKEGETRGFDVQTRRKIGT